MGIQFIVVINIVDVFIKGTEKEQEESEWQKAKNDCGKCVHCGTDWVFRFLLIRFTSRHVSSKMQRNLRT